MREYTISDADERIKLYTEEITTRNSDIAVKGTFIVSLFTFIILGSFEWQALVTVLWFFYVLLSGFSAFFALKSFGAKMKYYSEITVIAVMMVTAPIQWFETGGLYGIGNVWLIFVIVYIMFGTSGKLRKIMLYISALETLLIITATYLHPELVYNMTVRERKAASMASVFLVGGYILYVGIKQKIISDEATVKIALMQDDLTAQNEELIAVNDELIDLTEKLRNANETQRHFTASMNHELRSPLNGIEGCLQILQRSGKLDEEDLETVKNAIESTKTISQTVNDLLDFEKLETGKFDIIKRQFDLRELLNNECALFVPQAAAKGLEFRIHVPRSTKISLVGDGVRIQQIMNNLLSNAIKYTKAGKVVMAVTTNDSKLVIRVSDTGQGMSKENLEVLFDPFTRFNMTENVKIQGTGLGMNIVHNLVKEMKGTIEVDSKLGEGTVFHVSIPIMYYDSDITYATKQEENKAENVDDDLGGIRILYADDLKINRMVFRGLLNKCNVEITDLDSGTMAVEVCQDTKFDIIFLDHMMPDMDGVATLDAIHSHSANKDTPIVILTGNSGAEYTTLYEEHGAAGYIEKPLKYERLIETINNICREKTVSEGI